MYILKNTRKGVAALCAILALGETALADTRLLESFGAAEHAVVNFTQTPYTAELSCSKFIEFTEHSYTILSAEKFPSESVAHLEYCQIHGVIQPEIQFWLFLPDNWNGRFYMQGHGEYAGTAPFSRPYEKKIREALRHGFAVAFTDTGHDARYEPLGRFAYNELQKTLDYAYRAVHLTAKRAKALITEAYGRAPAYSYWDGCSTGGRQGLMEAQRFPGDFDGILAGAPVNDQTNLHIWMAWVYQALERTPIAPEKVVDILAPAVYEQCDGLDGLEDGLIQDPRMCRFEPAEHLPICADGDGAACFTPEEIEMLERIYGPVMSRGELFFPGLQPGAEAVGEFIHTDEPPRGTGWLVYLIDEAGELGRMERFADTFFRYFAFEEDDPEYDWRDLDFDEDPYRMDHMRVILDSVAKDMSAFKERGGKILSYHGWSDAGPPAAFTAKYYEEVLAAMGEEETRDFYRLFMVPGMFHCGGGFGTDFFDAMSPLIDWVEEGIVPERILARQRAGGEPEGAVERTRPLCPFPEYARYDGEGNPDDADSFVCTPPTPDQIPGPWPAWE